MMTRSVLCFSMALIILILSVSCFNSRKGNGIVGKWNRQNKDTLGRIVESEKGDWGDISFLKDSTFIINGNQQEDTSTVSVPGWHIGGAVKGKYRINENHLALELGEWERIPFSLNFEIIELTRDKLVLLSAFNKGDTTKYIVYFRYE